jgi:hypothetical protein
MIALFKDGTAVRCESYKAIESGVILCADDDREDVIGFAPDGELRYIVPDEAYEPPEGGESDAASDGATRVSYEAFGWPWFSITARRAD